MSEFISKKVFEQKLALVGDLELPRTIDGRVTGYLHESLMRAVRDSLTRNRGYRISEGIYNILEERRLKEKRLKEKR